MFLGVSGALWEFWLVWEWERERGFWECEKERGFWEERGEAAAGVLVWCGVWVVERVEAGGGRRRRVRSVWRGGRMSNVEGGGREMGGLVVMDGILGVVC